jgi:hypothetical protein
MSLIPLMGKNRKQLLRAVWVVHFNSLSRKWMVAIAQQKRPSRAQEKRKQCLQVMPKKEIRRPSGCVRCQQLDNLAW